ncbi:MAG: NFACT RNA binding domain-containing protein [candidate division WOR-3 bacterium]
MNGVYLHLALKEIEPQIKDKFIHRVAIQERLLQIELGAESLFVSLYPLALGLYVDKKKDRFEKLRFFDDHLAGARIITVQQIDFAPVVEFGMEKLEYGQQLTFKVRISFYREGPNFSFFQGQSRRDLFPRYIEKIPKRSPQELTPEDLRNKESLIKNFEGIDKALARELDGESLILLKEIINGRPYQIKLISIMPLQISLFATAFIREYSSWNMLLKDGINLYLEERLKKIFEQEQQKKMERLKKTIDKLQQEIKDPTTIENYRIAGELILANIQQIKKGIERVNLFNPYTQQEMEIKLDPQKTPQENAQSYFKEYKRLKKGIPKLQERIKKLQQELEALKTSTPAPKTISKQAREEAKEKPLPFRQFILNSGSQVLVGKNAQSNMELTFKFARPDDYFFHVRGYEGAHTLLRPVLQKGQGVKKEDIIQAAAIAAYFSKAKNQKNVPVSYTQRKYLKKSKKGKPGTVILMREEVIFVDPGLPAHAHE